MKLSGDQKTFSRNFNKDFKINLKSLPKQNNGWTMSGLNLLNSIGYLTFDEKSGKYSQNKFKKIKRNKIKEHSLMVGDHYLITSDNKGTIIKFMNNENSSWRKNIYNKK